MKLVLIAAMDQNRVIGKDGRIPWEPLSEDLKQFRRLTLYHPVIMGRKTWESLPEEYQPLPLRLNIVLSRQEGYVAKGAVMVHSLVSALAGLHQYLLPHHWRPFLPDGFKKDAAYVIGGQQIYEQALPLADRLELTTLDKIVEGDAYFPEFNREEWEETNGFHGIGYSFHTYQRRK